MAAMYAFIWLYGGISYARIGDTEIYYFLGWAVALAYIPFYLYRTRIEDKRSRGARRARAAHAAGSRAIEVTAGDIARRRAAGASHADGPDPDTLCGARGPARLRGPRDPDRGVDLAARIAKRSGAPVHVFTIARIWGTSFGFPNPGLNPTKREWDQQRHNVEKAIGAPGAQGRRGRRRAWSPRAPEPSGSSTEAQPPRLRRDRDGRRPDPQPADPRLHLVPGAVSRAAQGARAGLPRGRPDGPDQPGARSRRSSPATRRSPTSTRTCWRTSPRRPRRSGRRGRPCSSRTARRPTRSSSSRTGAMDLVHAGTVVDVLEPGQCFGHPSLLTGLAPAFTRPRARADDGASCSRASRRCACSASRRARVRGAQPARRLVRTGHTAHALPELA